LQTFTIKEKDVIIEWLAAEWHGVFYGRIFERSVSHIYNKKAK